MLFRRPNCFCWKGALLQWCSCHYWWSCDYFWISFASLSAYFDPTPNSLLDQKMSVVCFFRGMAHDNSAWWDEGRNDLHFSPPPMLLLCRTAHALIGMVCWVSCLCLLAYLWCAEWHCDAVKIRFLCMCQCLVCSALAPFPPAHFF